jgi:hypothetical protein
MKLRMLSLAILVLATVGCGNPMAGAKTPIAAAWQQPPIRWYAANCSNAAFAQTYWCQVPKTTTTTSGTSQ